MGGEVGDANACKDNLDCTFSIYAQNAKSIHSENIVTIVI